MVFTENPNDKSLGEKFKTGRAIPLNCEKAVMFTFLASEKSWDQETLVKVEVGDIGLEEDAELEGFPVRVIIDNKSTVDDVHSTTAVLDKKFRGDIGVIKMMLNEGDVILLHIVREEE